VLDLTLHDSLYEGVFCYALLHLFNKHDRKRFLDKCYTILPVNGM